MRLTEDEVATSLERYLATPVSRVWSLSGFVGNQNFMICTRGGDYVLKAGDEASLTAEAWACGRARTAGVPAPHVRALELDGSVLPRPFILMSCLPGAASDDRDQVLAEAGRKLKVLHSLTVDGFGFMQKSRESAITPRGPYGSWAEFTSEPVRCLDELVTNHVIDRVLAERLHAGLEEHRDAMAYEGPSMLLHGDLHPRHVFTRAGVLTGIIDWGDVCGGDPLFDLGRFSRADPGSLAVLLDGYGLDLTPGVSLTLRMYRLVWSTLVLREELRAGGDWFAVHRTAIELDLDQLA